MEGIIHVQPSRTYFSKWLAKAKFSTFEARLYPVGYAVAVPVLKMFRKSICRWLAKAKFSTF